MNDHFAAKAEDWDARPLTQTISQGVGRSLLKQVPLSPTWDVMDFGAGTGLLSGWLAPRVKRVWAVDVSPAMLERLAAKPELAGKVETCCRDILTQPLDRQFDLIVSAMALHHVEDTAALLRRFAEQLKPGGRVALADLDAEDGSFHPEGAVGVYHSGFDRDRLATLLTEAGFEAVDFTTAVTLNRESGDYPVFLVTARFAGSAGV